MRAGLLACAVLCACSTRVAAQDAGPPDACHGLCEQVVADVPIEINRDLDVLFVIDNAGGMSEEQAALVAGFPRFVSVLETLEGGLPNLHVGVVSTDVGLAGEYVTTGCIGDGDAGRLQNEPQGACAPPDGTFISDVAGPSGTRATNYTGTIEDVFGCIARLGTSGCGKQQQFESMKRALDRSRPENAGFLREDAHLAVVLLTDQDDCSVEDPALYDPAQGFAVTDPLGTFSFRCIEFGVVCDGAPIARTPAEYGHCEPRRDSYIFHPDHYVDFLRSLGGGKSVVVAGIIGDPSPFAVYADMDGSPVVMSSCVVPGISAAQPGVRLAYLIDQFAHRGTITSICNEDLGDPLVRIAQRIRFAMGSPCLLGDIPDASTCQAFDVLGSGETPLAACSTGALPCFALEPDPVRCADTPTTLAVRVDRVTPAPPGTHVVVRCMVDTP